MIDKSKYLNKSIHTCFVCMYRDKKDHELPCFFCIEIDGKKLSLLKLRKNRCITCEYANCSIYEGVCKDCDIYKNLWKCASMYKEYL